MKPKSNPSSTAALILSLFRKWREDRDAVIAHGRACSLAAGQIESAIFNDHGFSRDEKDDVESHFAKLSRIMGSRMSDEAKQAYAQLQAETQAFQKHTKDKNAAESELRELIEKELPRRRQQIRKAAAELIASASKAIRPFCADDKEAESIVRACSTIAQLEDRDARLAMVGVEDAECFASDLEQGIAIDA